jgi:hypothetical protein
MADVVDVETLLSLAVQSNEIKDWMRQMQPLLQEDAEDLDEDEAEPERWHRHPHVRQTGEQVVGERVLLDGREHADGDGDDERKQDAPKDELHRETQGPRDHRPDRPAGAGTQTKVAADNPSKPLEVLHGDWLVEPEADFGAGNSGRVFQ